jgi:FixJ family two-component response regulator
MTEEQCVVLVVEDDPSMRKTVDSLLRSVGLRTEVFESSDAFLKSKLPGAPSCLVLDVRLPGKSGLSIQSDLAAEGIDPPIIFISGHADVPTSVRAMKAGALEFLIKPFRDQDLLDAVEVALQRDRVRRADQKLNAELRARFDTLTAREQQVMYLVVAGRLNKQIAAELGISEMTAKIHRAQVFRKMQAVNLPDLVRMADKFGIANTRLSALTPKW